MFPFENNGEISFEVTKNEQELILENRLLESINLSTAAAAVTTTATAATTSKGRGRKSCASRPPNDTVCADPDTAKKKMAHRDIERQRRHEMSGLFSTLRSLLPSQYSKGKRSMSDHIVESVNYIKDMQKNIKVLGDKRDELKVAYSVNGNGYGNSMNELASNIQIYTNAVGLQVQIVVCQTQKGFSLSTALKILHEYGLDVVSTVSNAANGAFHHNIQCQANDTTCDNANLQWLQQRLNDAFG